MTLCHSCGIEYMSYAPKITRFISVTFNTMMSSEFQFYSLAETARKAYFMQLNKQPSSIQLKNQINPTNVQTEKSGQNKEKNHNLQTVCEAHWSDCFRRVVWMKLCKVGVLVRGVCANAHAEVEKLQLKHIHSNICEHSLVTLSTCESMMNERRKILLKTESQRWYLASIIEQMGLADIVKH